MDYGIAFIQNMFGMSVEAVKQLSINQYKTYLQHSINLIAMYRQGEVEMAYKNTKDDKLRARLKQLSAEAEARRKAS